MKIRDRIIDVRSRSEHRTRRPAASWKAIVALLIVATSTFLCGVQWAQEKAAEEREAGRVEADRQCPFEDRLSQVTQRDPGRA